MFVAAIVVLLFHSRVGSEGHKGCGEAGRVCRKKDADGAIPSSDEDDGDDDGNTEVLCLFCNFKC